MIDFRSEGTNILGYRLERCGAFCFAFKSQLKDPTVNIRVKCLENVRRTKSEVECSNMYNHEVSRAKL